MQPVMVEAAIQGQFKGSEGQHKRQHLTYGTQSATVMADSGSIPLVDPPHPLSCDIQSKCSLVHCICVLTATRTEQRGWEPPYVALCSCLPWCCCTSGTKMSWGAGASCFPGSLFPSLWLPLFYPRLLSSLPLSMSSGQNQS